MQTPSAPDAESFQPLGSSYRAYTSPTDSPDQNPVLGVQFPSLVPNDHESHLGRHSIAEQRVVTNTFFGLSVNVVPPMKRTQGVGGRLRGLHLIETSQQLAWPSLP